MRIAFGILLLSCVLDIAVAEEVHPMLPQTRAELTHFTATSRYDDVVVFVRKIQAIDPQIRVETFGTSKEGRALPLIVAGPAGVVDPRSAVATGKPVVLIMANIHAGEVEGKEAALMLLRDLVTTHKALREDMTILIAPIYNADGNERIAKTNRTTQNGPTNGVGVRENADGLDLNRDFMKLEAPEAQALVQNVLDRWDPLLTVDLHTTNGSFHGYSLTYAPPLNPNVSTAITAFEREQLLPEVTTAMRDLHHQHVYYYGNFVDQLQPEKGWYTFDSRPRFGTNYGGLRNRFTVLSEAYSYIDFESRIKVTHEFVHALLASVKKHATAMQAIAARADAECRSGKLSEQGVRFDIRAWKKDVEILWEKSVPAPAGEGIPDPETGLGPDKGHGLIRRTGEIVPTRMTDFGVFAAIETSQVPLAYMIAPGLDAVVANLRRHGVIVEKLVIDAEVDAASFEVTNATHAERTFQKHHETTLEGHWSVHHETAPAGSFVVRMRQPLARVAFYLLEPRSDDGFVAWNFFDDVKTGDMFPIRKVMSETAFVSEVMR